MLRWNITTRTLEELPTFSMASLASIGDLPDTIMDRAVVVRMRRRAPDEQVAPFRTRRDAPPLHTLRDALRAWVGTNLANLEKAVPEMDLEDRAADTWEPLVAVADLAGDEWPARARAAAKALVTAESEMEDTRGILLLEDMHTIFNHQKKLATTTILDALHAIEESPWSDVNGRGKLLDARGLALRLRPYGVKRTTIKIGDQAYKGYRLEDFQEPWRRYTPEGYAACAQCSGNQGN
jgi:hypothetical protein